MTDHFNEIFDLMENRLKHPGEVSTNDAWIICRAKFKCGYVEIAKQFKKIMSLLIEQGNAKQIKRGKYEILGKKQSTL